MMKRGSVIFILLSLPYIVQGACLKTFNLTLGTT